MTRFLLAHAQAAPQLRADFHQVEQISDGVYRIAVAARNEGYLPTHVTEQALKMKTADPVQARICIGPNDKLLVGKNREEIGHLAGYGGRRKVEWIVRFAEQPSAQISVACPRAGTARLDLADALTT